MAGKLIERPPLPVALGALTVLSGLIDAVSFLALGQVFTANMTGNLVLLGFAATGEPGFDIAASLTALGAFLAGVAIAARMAAALAERVPHRWFVSALSAEAALTALAALATFADARYPAVAGLALGMGIRNATVNRLAVPDMTTTVLTRTVTALAADLASRSPTDRGTTARRVVSVAGLVAGAVAGAFLVRHLGAEWVLVIVTGAQILVAAGHHGHVVLRRRAALPDA
ncbi:YoaK family protein [Amycolatopsis endophytica]|uniref:Uncharacterized membrane protein YoaK (UPF0700 family) n=1 Tax=Amycolatopsis endophytica TaxID=860233 RepID=A0A853BCK4_9PSEU|nr:YoaK family protein [Amycolatopsis endophytica]NYI92472.1 uncharacterized membrane protein YoaK (UPF0700 family) [Amycolatopsis endophytica]